MFILTNCETVQRRLMRESGRAATIAVTISVVVAICALCLAASLSSLRGTSTDYVPTATSSVPESEKLRELVERLANRQSIADAQVTSPVVDAGVLTVIGTPWNDSIRRVFAGRVYNVVTNFGTFNVPRRADVQSVFVRARDGNDIVNVAALPVQTTADVYAGAGNDRITGGRGHDVLVGDDDNDTITGGAGDDPIIGGAGRDRLVCSAGSDVLLAGILDLFEEDLCTKLDPREMLDIWRSAATPDDRLDAVQSLFDRILDDGEIDLLTGSAGADAFIRGDQDRMVDLTPDDLTLTV